MGSTVSVSKKVTAKLIGGEKFYWLFESTYEKNCYPHTPHEGCIGFGRIDKILERIFLFGSNCEGGMLQTPSGHITPESYIRRWLDLLENPMEMNVSPEPISVGAYGRAIREENLDDAVKILARNWTDGAECLKTLKKASVDWNELDQMLALEALCNSKNVFVWRIFDNSGAGLTNSELGYRFEKTGNHEIEPVVGWRVDSEEIVLKTGEFMRKAGWSYSIVGRFIQNEPSQPGFNPIDSLSRIKMYRKNIQAIPKWDYLASTVVVVKRSSLKDWERGNWSRQHIQKIIENPIPELEVISDNGVNVTVLVKAEKAQYAIPDTANWVF